MTGKGSFKGVVTVYLTLMISLMLAFVLGLVESVRIHTSQAWAKQALWTATESVMAEYNGPLYRRYGIFALDGGFGQGSMDLNALEYRLNQYIDVHLTGSGAGMPVYGTRLATMDSYKPLLADDCAFLKKQLLDHVKYTLPSELISDFLQPKASVDGDALEAEKKNLAGTLEAEDSRAKAAQASADAAKAEAEQGDAGQDGDGDDIEASPEDGAEALEDIKDPRESLSSLLSAGVLYLVTGPDYDLSEKELSGSLYHDLSPEPMMEDLGGFTQGDTFSKNLEAAETIMGPVKSSDNLGEKALVNLYILEKFKNGVPETDHRVDFDTALDYEVEYILWGHAQDKDNLKNMVNRLLLMRFIINMGYLMTDAGKTQAAMALATTLTVSLGLGLLAPVVKWLLLAVWAYGESIVDARQLFKGGKVPLIKNAGNWKLTLERLSEISTSDIEGLSQGDASDGLSYRAYLTMFLMTMEDDKKYDRMVNLMEQNIRLEEGYQGFVIGNSIYGIETTLDYTLRTAITGEGEFDYSINSGYCY